LNSTTARIAAVTSLTIPSVSRVAATRSRTGTTFRIGVTTVGPVAINSAPINSAMSQSASRKKRTAPAVPRNAIAAPIVVNRNTAVGASFILLILR